MKKTQRSNFKKISLLLFILTLCTTIAPASDFSTESDFLKQQGEQFIFEYQPEEAKAKLTRIASVTPDEPIENDGSFVVVAEFETSSSFVIGLEGGKSNQSTEIFRRQLVSPDNSKIYWLVEKRIGDARASERFYLEAGGDSNASATLKSFQIRPVSEFSNEEVLTASSFNSVTLKFKEIAGDQEVNQEAEIAFPIEIARRFLGQEVAVIFDAQIKTFTIGPVLEEGLQLWQQSVVLPLDVSEIGTRNVEVVIQSRDQEKLLELGSDKFKVTGPKGNIVDSFQIPFRDIQDYAVFYNDPDLRLIALPTDIYSKPEPKGFGSSSHEMIDYTISMESGRFRTHVGWRVPPFDHWAEESFDHLALGSIIDSHAVYVSGGNSENFHTVGHGAIISGSPLGTPYNNPIYFPIAELTGWMDGQGLSIQSAGAEAYLGNFLHLTQTTVYNQQPKIIASISNDIRKILDVKEIADLAPDEPYDYLQLYEKNGWYLLLTDQGIKSSKEPFGDWTTIEFVDAPDWAFQKLAKFSENRDYLFGLDEVEGRQIIRWKEFTIDPQPFSQIKQ